MKRDWKLIEMAIHDSNLALESELSYNRRPNSLESDFEPSIIQFGGPNYLSLVQDNESLLRSVLGRYFYV